MKQTKHEKAIDRRIEEAYRRNCTLLQINILDIGKVFDFGRKAIERGEDDDALGASLLAYVKSIAIGTGVR